MNRITYVSALDESGYAQAAIAYVRGLVNAGVRVHWQQFAWPAGRDTGPRLLSHDEALSRAQVLSGNAQNDLAVLLQATRLPLPTEALVMHTIPEYFPLFAMPNCALIGMTAWETSKIPPQWISLCNIPHRLIVPSLHNLQVFSAARLRSKVHAVAHIRRNRWSEFTTSQLDDFRAAVGLEKSALTFYCVSTADPRKNIRGLLNSYCRAFTSDQAVQLLIKTSEMGYDDHAPFMHRPAVPLLEEWLNDITAALGRSAPHVRVIANNRLTQRDIDALHEIGDCYVSFSRGEGWGLGAFDAATFGNPVLMPDWGGQVDFLPSPRRAAMPIHLDAAPIWPTHKPSMWNDQSWANVHGEDGVKAFKDASINIDTHRSEARRIQGFIANEFSEERVTKQLLAAVDGELDA